MLSLIEQHERKLIVRALNFTFGLGVFIGLCLASFFVWIFN